MLLTDIVVDPSVNVRDGLDEATVEHYAAIFERLPPPVVYRLPDGTHLLAAGFHRMEAARRRGLETIEVEVREGTRRDAEVLAILDNAAHGRPYTRAERRRAIGRMLRLHPERADNWIAAELGVDGKTVRVVREEMEATSEIPKLERLVGRDGRERRRGVERAAGEGERVPAGAETRGGDGELGSNSGAGDELPPNDEAQDGPRGQRGGRFWERLTTVQAVTGVVRWEERHELIRAEVLDWLTGYEGPRFHAAIGDAPYGLEFLGLAWDRPGGNGFRRRHNPADVGRESVFGRLSARAPGFDAGLLRRYQQTMSGEVGFDGTGGGPRPGGQWNLGGGSLYQRWVTEWASALVERALHPGAVVAFFGGTRTWQRLACGLEDAGFEIFDTIVVWLYGQGMAKGLDVSKDLDRRAFLAWLETVPHGLSSRQVRLVASAAVQGVSYEERHCRSFEAARRGPGFQVRNFGPDDVRAGRAILADLVVRFWDGPPGTLPPGVRQVVGERQHGDGSTRQALPRQAQMGYDGGWKNTGYGLPVSVPSTSDAARWQGYNTHLKPAWEPVILARAPTQGLTYAGLATRYGTGLLNIDGCRIPIADDGGAWGSSNATCAPLFNASPGQHEYRSRPHPAGRWPANVMLDEEAAMALDATVGELRSGGFPARRVESKGWSGRWSEDPDELPHAGHLAGDRGGPSRFFQYVPKVPRWEAHVGLGDFYWATAPDSPTGFRRVSREEWEELPRNRRARGNVHPTRKPIRLLQTICELLLPPPLPADACPERSRRDGHGPLPRRLLDLFCGSGPGLVAGMYAGWDEVVGVEMIDDYVAMAEARLAWWLQFESYEQAAQGYRGQLAG